MEFKNRANDEKRSTYTHQSSNFTHFSDQAFRVDCMGFPNMRPGYPGPNMRPGYPDPNMRPGYPGPNMGPGYPGPNMGPSYSGANMAPGYSGPNMGRPHEYYQNPIEMREAIWRELEKEKIREEIIAEEIARRRMLEAEVRRELMIERELAMRRGDDGFLFSPMSTATKFEQRALPAPPPLPQRAEGMSLEERIGKSLEERFGMSAMLRLGEFGGLETTPFQPRRSAELRISEVEPASEISKEKERIILLAKPEADLSGVKRKAKTPTAVRDSELPSAGVTKKKVKEEWSCAICQVSATSERGLNEHLQGRRHKAKESGLKKNGKIFSIGLYPKKTVKPNKITDIAGKPSSEQGIDILGESLQTEKLGQSSLLTESNSGSPKEIDVPLLTQIVATFQRKQKNGEHKKKKFVFWCEMCKVGAFTEKAMEEHRTGKKHIARLKEVNENGGAVPSTQIKQATKVLNDAGEAGKDGEIIVSEIANGIVDGIKLEGDQTAEADAGDGN